jgi:hypothetical protein
MPAPVPSEGGRKRFNKTGLLVTSSYRCKLEGTMLATGNRRRLSSITLIVLLLPELITAQILGIGRENTELTRLRPAGVHLANQTVMVKINPIDSRAAGMTERMQKLIINKIIGVNKNMREVSKSPYYMVDCSITRYDYNEKTETKKLLMIKEQGTFKIISATLEASYNVVRVSGNAPLFGGNISAPYKKEFQVGVETTPVKAEIENALIRSVVDSILVKLTNTEEKVKVRLMGKDELSRFARLAQAGQWVEYIDSIKALPEQKPDKNGQSSFEGDRHYNLSIAYEARFYDTMWKDYKRAEQYFELADSALRKARQFDPRESEYIKAQARLGQGKQYFDTIKERYPKDVEVPQPPGDPTPLPPPGAMTNKEVIDMVNSGVSERLIVEQINEAKVKQFDTSAKGIIQLTTAGVSEKVIDTIKNTTRRKAPAPPPPIRKPARKASPKPENKIVIPNERP